MDTRILCALKAMQQSCSKGMRLSTLAKDAGLSRSRFGHLFKEQMGCSFKAMLKEIRLTKAERLLGDRRLSVKEIAALVGYSSSLTFIREFRNRFGLSPSRLRGSTFG